MGLAERTASNYEIVERIIEVGETHDGIFLASNGKDFLTNAIGLGSLFRNFWQMFLTW